MTDADSATGQQILYVESSAKKHSDFCGHLDGRQISKSSPHAITKLLISRTATSFVQNFSTEIKICSAEL